MIDYRYSSIAFDALAKRSGLSPKILSCVMARYQEEGRFYHDSQHLVEIATRAEHYKLNLSRAQAIAILFHDVVYVPGAPTGMNEQMSALLMRSMLLNRSVDDHTIALAEQIILDTSMHIPSGTDSALVLDLDLLGLAGREEWLSRDSERVYEEVENLVGSWDAYLHKRKAFFKSLLVRRRILHSKELMHLECRLRGNLERAIIGVSETGTQ